MKPCQNRLDRIQHKRSYPIVILCCILSLVISENTCSKGDKKCEAKACFDSNNNCQFWARQGECRNNPKFMLEECKRTCGECPSQDKYDKSMQLLELEMLDEESMVYVQPDVSSFYQKKHGTVKAVEPAFKGNEAKFVNLGPDDLDLYKIEDMDDSSKDDFVTTLKPYESVGYAGSEPGDLFAFSLNGDVENNEVLKWINIESDRAVYIYDAYRDKPARYTQDDLLSDEYEYSLYKAYWKNLIYAKYYSEMTGRQWLGFYPRPKFSHSMLPADFFGQQKKVKIREVHFTKTPPMSKLGEIQERGAARLIDFRAPRILQEYRDKSMALVLNTKVISCAPRVIEIKNFLSDVEASHIIDIGASSLEASEVNRGPTDHIKSSFRTSSQTWIFREASPIVDAIYRRAADVLGIDEAYFRERGPNELPDFHVNTSIAEPLQLVHYDVGQSYGAHYDIVYPHVDEPEQPSRFATILIYLNDDVEGGQTAFPKWVNAKTSGPLKVRPEKGKAIVFYNMLPDGNYDALSLHESLPVTKGEKWLLNLWIWDPFL